MRTRHSIIARSPLFATLLTLTAIPSLALGQAAGVPIEPKRLPNNPTPQLNERLHALRDGGKLLSLPSVREALKQPTPSQVTLPPRATEPLRPSKLVDRMRQSALRIGWHYLCNHCNNWHLKLSGGYVITADGVGVTCHHVFNQSDADMREGYVFAMSQAGEIYPITQILAADADIDAAVFRCDAPTPLVPFPINDDTTPGDSVYLLSDPGGVAGYFSAGMINRFYWEGVKRDGDLTQLADAKFLRMDVSADWAPGSSGSALVDDCGNVVGHVSKISTLMAPDQWQQTPPRANGPSTTQSTTRAATTAAATQAATPASMPARAVGTHVVLHEASPIRAVRLLVESLKTQPPSTAP